MKYLNKDKFTLIHRDLYWIIAILVGIIILICSIRLSNNINLINIFSFMASGISIALAFVAIGMSIKQESTSSIINSETRNMLSSMNEKIIGLDFKISNIDLESIQDLTSAGFNKLAEKFNKILNEKFTILPLSDDSEKIKLKATISKEISEIKEDTSKQIKTIFTNNSYLNATNILMMNLREKFTDTEWDNINKSILGNSNSLNVLKAIIQNDIEKGKKIK